jgi:hypothetical protein
MAAGCSSQRGASTAKQQIAAQTGIAVAASKNDQRRRRSVGPIKIVGD